MKFYLISDNVDTQMGMRLAGIEGVVAHTEKEVNDALDFALLDKEIAVVLMTEKLVSICHDRVYDLKLNCRQPIIVEIPDRHGNSNVINAIGSYVEDAIGVKL